ncbi:hypothetical protein F4819DRAFT_446139 [Hypoxylon fuscum]|nr:hypothetical protein F4819DRAFT_446139 [Hypoxylon fuscum]
MRCSAFLRMAPLIYFSHFSESRPMRHTEGLSEVYIETMGSNIVANATTTTPSSISTPDKDTTGAACKPFIMPAVPEECLQKTGELVCHGFSLYCRFPTDWGVGYDPIGECWTCKS